MEPATYHIPTTMDAQPSGLAAITSSTAVDEVGGCETRQFTILSNVHHPSVTPSIVSVPAAQLMIPSRQLPPIHAIASADDGLPSFVELTPLTAAVPSASVVGQIDPTSGSLIDDSAGYQPLMMGNATGSATVQQLQQVSLAIRSQSNSRPAVRTPLLSSPNATDVRTKASSCRVVALKVEPQQQVAEPQLKHTVALQPALAVESAQDHLPHITLLSQQQQLDCQTVHLERMAEKLAELQKSVECLATTSALSSSSVDPSFLAFAKCTADLAQLTYVTVAELSGRVGNQAAHINGILLRRGSAAGNTLGSGEYLGGAKGDKMPFNLNRCDHRLTLYDPEAGKKADLVEIFEKFFIGKPKHHSPEELTMTLTEYTLNTLYPVETEKWTYCVRYSSRNGHKTVPHVLIEEMKMQIAKGFGVFNSVRGVSTNLAVGAAVVNKATRFFNAKRRVSTRASQRKLASSLRDGEIRNYTANNNETSSNKSCSSIDNELDDGGFGAGSHNADELLAAEGPAEKMARFAERPADSVSVREEARARELNAYRVLSIGDMHSLEVKEERRSPSAI